MEMLIGGVVLWWAAHLFKRVTPGLREGMGSAGRGVVTLFVLVALALMIVGYRAVPNEPDIFYFPGNGHANNMLMLIAVIVFGAGMSKGWLWTKIRHPMLWGATLWAIAHLIVHNGLPSLILFGGMGLWAVVEMVVINAATGPWVRPASGGGRRDLVLVAIALIMYALIVGIHQMLGLSPVGIATFTG